ncbi:MAG: FHA domain-containing protein [Myxococcota bacterium]|jgi:hypothetical protein|nr:FHA domain-containing protein [Myxococcota bacterium]
MRYLSEARADALYLDQAGFARLYRGSALVLHTIKGGKLQNKAKHRIAPPAEKNPLAGRTLVHDPMSMSTVVEGIHDPEMFQDRRFHREALVLLQDADGGTGRIVTVGRVGRCSVVINDYSVSGLHAAYSAATRFKSAQIRDRESSNGTFLNGERLKSEKDYTIRTGDTLRMGRVEMVYIDSRDFYHFLRGDFSNLQLEAAFGE